jgi:predicted membrane-bound dolichyl-phosphate-mannose-protein mannosyltransferase
MAHRLRATSLPFVLLAVVSILSFAARVAWIGEPCQSPCRTAADHLLIFDEAYYVNAARVIASVRPPAGQHYVGAPPGDDPNAEHPQLAKLEIAGAIELFGDGPFAWRIGSIVLGSLAIIGMFVLARAGGAGDWLALGAAALMASDNLLLVHGRIGTLDIYALTAMIWGVALYLRGRRWIGGAVLGVGAACKLVAPYAVLVLLVFELLRDGGAIAAWRRIGARVGGATAVGVATFFALLAVMDRVAPPYDPVAGKPVAGGVLPHLGHMISYAAGQSSPHGPTGIASYPWEWLVDYKPIVYLNINPSRPSPGLEHVHPSALFLGMISPPLLLLALPALVLVAAALAGRPRRLAAVLALAGDLPESSAFRSGDAPLLGLAWAMGTLAPFAALSLFWQRTSYLYYMVIVMPGIYLVAAHLALRLRRRRRIVGAWAVSVLIAAVVMYPFMPLL